MSDLKTGDSYWDRIEQHHTEMVHREGTNTEPVDRLKHLDIHRVNASTRGLVQEYGQETNPDWNGKLGNGFAGDYLSNLSSRICNSPGRIMCEQAPEDPNKDKPMWGIMP